MSNSGFGNREVKGREMSLTAFLAGKSDLLVPCDWPSFPEFSPVEIGSL
jgi:hypothetical protein